MNSEEVRQKHAEFLFPAVKNYYAESAVLYEGKGSRIRDLDGHEYLDFFGGILTVALGHAHDGVNAAVSAQLGRLSHVSTLYPTLPLVQLAESLANLTGNLKKCFFTASGTEADETAVMIAQTHTGNSEIIALRHGYSGRSMLAQSLTGHSSYRAVAHQVPAVRHAHAPYCYRCPFKLRYPECGLACATDIEELIQTTTSGKIAGMIAEPILGVGGFIVPPKEYFEIAAQIVRKYGGVFIADEVQTGLGRTGGKMWGIEHFGVEPDIMTMAKGIANGLPLAAIVATVPIADSLSKSTISTFGGNPLSCAAANAVLHEIEDKNLLENAHAMGELLGQGLQALKERFPKIVGDVRGMGLMRAIEFVADETHGDRTPNPAAAGRFLEITRKRGLLIGRGGLYANTIRIAPALNIDATEIAEAIQIMNEALQEL